MKHFGKILLLKKKNKYFDYFFFMCSDFYICIRFFQGNQIIVIIALSNNPLFCQCLFCVMLEIALLCLAMPLCNGLSLRVVFFFFFPSHFFIILHKKIFSYLFLDVTKDFFLYGMVSKFNCHRKLFNNS